VTFSNHEEANIAMVAMDNSVFFGRRINVKWFHADTDGNQAMNATPGAPPLPAFMGMQGASDSAKHDDPMSHLGQNDLSSNSLLTNLVDVLLNNYLQVKTSFIVLILIGSFLDLALLIHSSFTFSTLSLKVTLHFTLAGPQEPCFRPRHFSVLARSAPAPRRPPS
jgi:hypothetical protein